MKFRCLLSERVRFPSPCGSVTMPEYSREIKADGSCNLKKVGCKNTQYLIQESSKGHLLCDLIKRSRIGDTSAIPTVDESVFGDASNIPKDLMSAANLSVKVNQLFDSLPADVRSKYDNSSLKFMKAVSENSQDLINHAAAASIASDKLSKASNTKSLADAINSLIGGKSNESNS